MRTLFNTFSVLPFEREDAGVAAQLLASLKSQGMPVGATSCCSRPRALQRGLKIVTTMRESSVASAGLGLEDWYG